MMSLTYLWMNRRVSLELSYYCSFFSGVDWMLPVETAERRHGLEKMLSLRWHLDFMDRFQNIWNLRQHCLGWQHACVLVWIILKLELSWRTPVTLPSVSFNCFIRGWFQRLGEMFIIVTTWTTAYNKYIYLKLRKYAMRYSPNKWLRNLTWFFKPETIHSLTKYIYPTIYRKPKVTTHYRFPLRGGIRSSGILRSVHWYLPTFRTHRLSRPPTVFQKSEVLIQYVRLDAHNDNTAQNTSFCRRRLRFSSAPSSADTFRLSDTQLKVAKFNSQ